MDLLGDCEGGCDGGVLDDCACDGGVVWGWVFLRFLCLFPPFFLSLPVPSDPFIRSLCSDLPNEFVEMNERELKLTVGENRFHDLLPRVANRQPEPRRE